MKSAAIVVILGIAVGLILQGVGFSFSFNSFAFLLGPTPSPTPAFTEMIYSMSAEERATMSAEFTRELERMLASSESGTGVPTGVVAGAATVKPTITTIPSPTRIPTITPTPLPPDTTAPVVKIQGGPGDGTTVYYANVCFSLYITDNQSKPDVIDIRTRMDSRDWGDWQRTIQPCFNDLYNGMHIFTVQARDIAGNVSNEEKRVFTVSVK